MASYKKGGLDMKRYTVQKSNGKPVDPKAKYLVLRADKDPHALIALEAYAESVCLENEQLSDDINALIDEVQKARLEEGKE